MRSAKSVLLLNKQDASYSRAYGSFDPGSGKNFGSMRGVKAEALADI